MLRIYPRTTEQPIPAAGGTFKPGAPLFMFKNTGNTDMFINNVRYSPGDIWGIDHTVFLATLLAAGKQAVVDDATEYRISFGSTVTDTSVYPGIFANVPQPNAILITTQYMF